MEASESPVWGEPPRAVMGFFSLAVSPQGRICSKGCPSVYMLVMAPGLFNDISLPVELLYFLNFLYILRIKVHIIVSKVSSNLFNHCVLLLEL